MHLESHIRRLLHLGAKVVWCGRSLGQALLFDAGSHGVTSPDTKNPRLGLSKAGAFCVLALLLVVGPLSGSPYRPFNQSIIHETQNDTSPYLHLVAVPLLPVRTSEGTSDLRPCSARERIRV